jgi:hypothetical protein
MGQKLTLTECVDIRIDIEVIASRKSIKTDYNIVMARRIPDNKTLAFPENFKCFRPSSRHLTSDLCQKR